MERIHEINAKTYESAVKKIQNCEDIQNSVRHFGKVLIIYGGYRGSDWMEFGRFVYHNDGHIEFTA